MAIRVTSQEPNAFLAALRKAIDDGTILHWACDEKGDLYVTPGARPDELRRRHTTQLLMLFLEHFPELCPGLEFYENELEEPVAEVEREGVGGWSGPR